LLLRRPSSAEVRAAKHWLWDIASRHLAPRPRAGGVPMSAARPPAGRRRRQVRKQ
jgi:hypothetical protein